MRSWSIQVHYQTQDDAGRTFRATAVFHCEAADIPSAYQAAAEAFGPDKKLGAIMPGKHLRFP
ncbi:hypothetical protein CC53_gp132 [Rhizobium phage vB_RleS_L338C]|uniref:hypothetical protein n=1 Tax=Rhizobium phage vB_RleS_L338C TaxID=1414737 RepID=UPI0003D7B5AF|nr:hypothetical protein CC53_gp132 [Rhizobium phage vB_RleS_L338C]AHC30549.1 hypothetical protein L338C_132 [Rhizobium phage vB_RleS_L338C]QNH72189.1 hypothetical protein P11VFA_018 [Rhizobium phage P11VFA]